MNELYFSEITQLLINFTLSGLRWIVSTKDKFLLRQKHVKVLIFFKGYNIALKPEKTGEIVLTTQIHYSNAACCPSHPLYSVILETEMKRHCAKQTIFSRIKTYFSLSKTWKSLSEESYSVIGNIFPFEFHFSNPNFP